MASRAVNLLDCDCSLHTHADNLSYGAYVDVKKILDEGTRITDTIITYCNGIQVEDNEKGAE